MSKKILILGGSGLLGQTLVSYLSLEVYIVCSASRYPSFNNDNIKEYAVNILDAKYLDELIRQFDIVINCTGQITNPITNCYQQNTIGIKNIINSVKRHKVKLIHISSVSVYGSCDYVDENSNLNPETVYGTIKGFAEFQISTELKDYVILRVSNLYGKNQKKGIINYLTKSFESKERKLYFNNNGGLKRYYLHVNDFAIILNKILQHNLKGMFNIIGNDYFSIKELIFKFEDILNYKFDVLYENREAIDNVEVINDSKIKKLFHIEYSMNIEKYIKDLKNEAI